MEGLKVSFLSTNKIRICLDKNETEKVKLKEKQLKGVKQLRSYGFEFLKHLSADDEPITIYCCNEILFKLACRILQRTDNFYEQLLNYETYQKLDFFYLSIVTIRNLELEDEPVIPICYLIHEQNTEAVHLDFWNRFVIKKLNYQVPISVSKERCIMDGALKCLKSNASNKLFFCSNKLVRDANEFYLNHLKDKENEIKFKSDEQIDHLHCKTGIENLVSCNTMPEYEENLNEFKSLWTSEYWSFFEKEVSPFIIANIERRKPSNLRIKFIKKNDNLLEPLDSGPEFSLTDLIFKLFRSSCEIVLTFNEIVRNEKSQRLNYKFLPYAKQLIIKSKYLEYMNEKCRKKQLSCIRSFNKMPSIFNLFHFEIADLVICNDLVYFDKTNNVFLCKSIFNESVNTIYDDDGITKCTCSLQTLCFHKIAAKFISELV